VIFNSTGNLLDGPIFGMTNNLESILKLFWARIRVAPGTGTVFAGYLA
jgi:hypothetical protein